ncbi:MAG: hypothetical protein LBT00_10375 [Spirochaetaceae bacterium]|nr:hypothetical protein [Spirochaetaceae bacterium]
MCGVWRRLAPFLSFSILHLSIFHSREARDKMAPAGLFRSARNDRGIVIANPKGEAIQTGITPWIAALRSQ